MSCPILLLPGDLLAFLLVCWTYLPRLDKWLVILWVGCWLVQARLAAWFMVAWLLGWLAGWYVFGRAVHLRLVYGFVWVDSLARGKNELDAPNINLKTPVSRKPA